jgi:hypothetical protein
MTQSTVTHQTVRLTRGKHQSPDAGACVMELASMLAGEPFSDRPQTACPVIGAFLRSYNDAVDDQRRQDLYRCAAEIIGTRAGADVERERMQRCLSALAELEAARPRLRRWISRPAAPSLPLSSIALERMGVRLARALQRDRDGGHAAAMALLDELIALGARDGGRAPATVTVPARDRRAAVTGPVAPPARPARTR